MSSVSLGLHLVYTIAGLLAMLGVARRFLPGRTGERLAWSLAGFMAVTVLETQGLGIFWRQYTLRNLLVIETLLYGGLLIWLRASVLDAFRDVWVWVGRKRLLLLLPAMPLAVWVYVLAFTWIAPVPGYDAQGYHLPIAVEMVKHQGFDFFEARSGHVNEFPKNGHMLFARAFLFGLDERALRPIQWAFGLMAVLALHGWMRNWGVGQRVALAVAPLYLLVPAVLAQGMLLWGTIDLIFGSLLILLFGGLAWMPADRKQALARALFAAAAAGLAIGTKGQGLLVAGSGFLLLVATWALRRPWAPERQWKIAVPTAGALLILLGSYTYIQNLFWFGNPFNPIELRIGDRIVFSGHFQNVDRLVETRKYTGERRRMEALVASMKPLWAYDWVYSERRVGQWGTAWWLFLMPGAVAGIVGLLYRRRWREAIIGATMVYIFLHTPGNWWARFSLHAFGFALVLAACAVSAIPWRAVRTGLVAWGAGLSLLAAAEAVYTYHVSTAPWRLRADTAPFLWALDTYHPDAAPDEYPDRDVYRWVQANIKPGDSIVYFHPSFWGIFHYYYYRPDLANRVYGVDTAFTIDEMGRMLDERAATHIIAWDTERPFVWGPLFGEQRFRSGRYVIFERTRTAKDGALPLE